MPSDFVSGRPQQRKTLADLISKLTQGPSGTRPFFSTAPSKALRAQPRDKKSGNKETAEARRKRLAREALKGLKE